MRRRSAEQVANPLKRSFERRWRTKAALRQKLCALIEARPHRKTRCAWYWKPLLMQWLS